MESSAIAAPVHKIPRSEYIPATLKQTRDKVFKGKTNHPSEAAKNSNVNKSPRTSRIPKQTIYNPRAQKDNPDKRNVTKGVRSPVDIKKNIGADQKQKTSHIPRRRNDIKEPILKGSGVGDTEITTSQELPTEHQNVQRVQLLNIDTDFYPEHPLDASAKAKPIPTYAQIYRHNYITDWGLESLRELIDISDNSLYSVPRIMEVTEENNDFHLPQNHIIIDSTQNRDYASNRSDKSERSTLCENEPRGAFKTTNENVRDWLTSEFEQVTRDNESGYRSMSPPSKITSSIKSKHYENLTLRTFGDETEIIKKSDSSTSTCRENNQGSILTEHETVVVTKNGRECHTPQNVYQAIPKINTDFKNIPLNTDLRKNIKFPSTPNPVRHRENANSIPVPSYVECPSEVVQKTTNFEGIDILSSVADTEVETCEDMSQCTLRQMEEDSVLEDQDHLRDDWSQQASSSQASIALLNLSKTSDAMTNNTWYSQFNEHRRGLNEDSERKWSDNYNYHDYYHHYCWRKEVNRKFDNLSLKEHKGRCMKCQKCRRKSKSKRRLSQPFEVLRKRISIGRICRPRWKGVWKRTAERWSKWTKAPSKFRKSKLF